MIDNLAIDFDCEGRSPDWPELIDEYQPLDHVRNPVSPEGTRDVDTALAASKQITKFSTDQCEQITARAIEEKEAPYAKRDKRAQQSIVRMILAERSVAVA